MFSQRSRLAGVSALLTSLLLGVMSSSAAAADDHRLVRGRVVYQADQPVAGATLVLVLRHGFGENNWLVDARSDRDGRFEMQVPAKWTEPGAFYHSRTVWSHAAGYGVATASAYKQLDEGSDEPIEITLPPAASLKVKVLDPAGEPHKGCRVEPHHWQSGDIPPESIRDLVMAVTDEQGVAELTGVPPDQLRRLATHSDDYGVQRKPFTPPTDSTPFTIHLQEAGTVVGRLVCDDPKAAAGVTIGFEQIGGRAMEGLTEGAGVTETDSAGRFRVERLVVGPYDLFVGDINTTQYRPKLPEEVIVRPGEETLLEITCEPTVLVRGSVVARGSDRPVTNAYVSIRHGGRFQSEQVLTDSEGKFTADVLPGEVRQQLIRIPQPFTTWVRPPYENKQYEVTRKNEPFELPPLEILKPTVVAGKLIDERGEPVAEARVYAVSGNSRLGHDRTKNDGSFQLRFPEGVKIDGYVAWIADAGSPGEKRRPLKVVSEDDLLLQLVDPLERANVSITTAPTPADKLQPTFEEDEGDSRPILIVAKNALIYDGRATNWAELTDAFVVPTTVYYYRTHETFKDPQRQTEARDWAEVLSKTTPATIRQGGLILNQMAELYDSLAADDPWPPGAEKPVVGRAVSAEGRSVADAQVLLLRPPAPTARLRHSPSVYLRNGQVRSLTDFISTKTDAEGRFQFDFPSQATSVMILAPEGIALVAASTKPADIRLTPWARVTATMVQDRKVGPLTASLTINARPVGGGPMTMINLSAGNSDNPQRDFELPAVPAIGTAHFSRTLWQTNDQGQNYGNTYGSRLPLDLEPGVTTHLEFAAP